MVIAAPERKRAWHGRMHVLFEFDPVFQPLDVLLELILRFKGFEKVIAPSTTDYHLFHNTKVHTTNCRMRAMMLPVSEEIWELIDRCLKSHDLAEIQIGDVLAYLVSKDLAVAEKQAIEALPIPDEDKDFIRQFNLAKRTLEGRRIKGQATVWAVFSVLIDFIDAAEFFHHNVPKWADLSTYKEGEMPENKALVYAIDVCKRYLRNLPKLGFDKEHLVLAENLLLWTLDWIVSHWGQIPQNRIPRKMKRKLCWAQRELERRIGVDADAGCLLGLKDWFPLSLAPDLVRDLS